jgi:hypothetical protein
MLAAICTTDGGIFAFSDSWFRAGPLSLARLHIRAEEIFGELILFNIFPSGRQRSRHGSENHPDIGTEGPEVCCHTRGPIAIPKF